MKSASHDQGHEESRAHRGNGAAEHSEMTEAEVVASVKAFLRPRSIAVVGASRRANSIGNRLFQNVLRHGFSGVVYPVNPNADAVASVKAYPSVVDVPGEVDLAIVAVPADKVPGIIDECGRKGVRGAIVISAGFREIGPEGAERENRIQEMARRYGMRLIGPNCMGVINTAGDVSLNATFSLVFPPGGKIAFGTQSGALGLAILEYARDLNIGLSTFVSIGNRADVSSNDLLQYWKEDPETDVVLLYLESFGNPRNFLGIARRLTPGKPVVAIKSGRTAAGSRAAASHTGALATAETATDALFIQAGIIRANTLEELFDIANLLSHQPVPAGRRLAILTNGGGLGILTADACAARSLELPALSDDTVDGLREFTSSSATFANPVDMTAEASAEEYRRALGLLAADDGIDIVIVIFIPPIVTEPEAVAAAIRDVSPDFRRRGKTLVASFLGWRGATHLGSEDDCCVPSFAFPEAAAAALSAACSYGEWLRRPVGTVPSLPRTDTERATAIVAASVEGAVRGPAWMKPPAAVALLDSYGIPVVASKEATTSEQAASAAGQLGFPVALKLLSDTLTHKTDVGGVALGLHSADEVTAAFEDVRRRLEGMGRAEEMRGAVIQPMVSDGVEVIVGVTQDPSLGPLILFGLGGVHTELFQDTVFRFSPLTDTDAAEMVRSVRAYRLLEGWRGAARRDTAAIEELLLRVSAMLQEHPEILELDLNPVMVLREGKGCVVVDARVLVGTPTA